MQPRLSPHGLAWLALTLPFRRFAMFVRSGGVVGVCWLSALALIAAFAVLNRLFHDVEGIPLILMFAQFFILAGLVAGLRFLSVNWRRVAVAWPESPKGIRFWIREATGRSLFADLGDPVGLLRSTLVAIPTIILCAVVLFAAIWADPALGAVAIYLVPVMPLALISALSWPRSASLALDETPLSGAEARSMARGTFLFRLCAYAWVFAASWWPAATLLLLLGSMSKETSGSVVLAFPILLLPWLMIVTAWLSGLGALLYARLRSSAVEAVFD